uniref:Uncharacterized protein n=1 Tax=Romanomermis culicivorax TaxID=13658 RepID=A0A915ID80_ROMCU
MIDTVIGVSANAALVEINFDNLEKSGDRGTGPLSNYGYGYNYNTAAAAAQNYGAAANYWSQYYSNCYYNNPAMYQQWATSYYQQQPQAYQQQQPPPNQ